jgi:predicted CxxxxCH...CXXCH cytochrome family protein
MGKVIKKNIQGMSWWMKTSLVLLLTLTSMVFMNGGWISATGAQAAATWQATGTRVSGTSAITPVWPAHAVGDVALLFVETANQAVTLSTAAGFTAVSNSPQSTGTAAAAGGTSLTVFWARATSTSMTNPVVADSGDHQVAVILTFRGVTSAGNPWDVTAGSVKASASTTTTFPAVTTTTAGDLIVLAAAVDRSAASTNNWSAFTNANLSGLTERFDETITSGAGGGLGIATGVKATAGSTGTTTGTLTSSITTQMTIALKPEQTDTTPPTAGAVTITPDISGTYTSAAPTITTQFTDAESAVSSCQYTTNGGTTWIAGVVSGASTPYTCTANPTGLTGFLNINMRATSGGGLTTATQIQRTVDTTVPTDGTLTATVGNTQNSISWTAAIDTGGSGIASYILRFATGATAPASCTVGTAVPGSPFSAATLSTTHTGLTNGTQYSYRLCATDNLGNTTGGVTKSATPAVGPVATLSSCNGCHGYTTTFNDGTARNIPAGQFQGSHNGHVIVNAYACSVCHSTPATATSADFDHANGTIIMAAPINGNAGAAYTKGAGWPTTNSPTAFTACSNTNCHGATSPTWGANTAKVRCQKCHGYRSSGWNALNGATVTTDTKVGAHFNHISSAGTVKYAKPFSCAECHAASIALSTDNVNAAGHFDTAGPADVSFGALAKTNTNTPTYSAAACATNYCHGSNMASNVSNPPASRTATPTWNAPLLGVASVVGNGSTTPGTGDCSKCHGYPPMTSTHAGKLATACSGCHSHVNASGTGFTNAALHINGVVDASGGDCTTCHNAQQGTGTRRVVGTDTALVSHHMQATTINAATCSVCHEQSAFGHQVAGDVAVGMFNQDTGAALTYDGTTATAANLENSCNSCHDANGASRLGANALKPFTASGDNTAPPFIGWSTGKQAHSATMACFNCHGNSAGVAGNTLTPKYNAHGSATAKMLQYTYTATDAMTTTTNFCYNCHGTTIANGVVSPSIQATVALSTTIGHKSAKCSDCHDQHSAKPGLHTIGANAPMAPVLNGVTGKGGWPATNPAAATTWTGTGTLAVTYTAKPVATKEYEICFKCHAGSVPVPTGYTVGALRMTDLGLEFNPANKSGHPIIAGINSFNGGTALTAAKMVAPWATTLGTQTMTCSDCHGAAGTGAKGPHGSSVRWMLTGTNQAWPFTTTAGNGTATGTTWKLGNYNTGTAPNTLFCRNCHPIANTNTAHSNVGGGEHSGWASGTQGACVSCHIRIPHGGKVGRLIRPGTAALLGRYAPDGNGGEISGQSQQFFTSYSKPLSFTGYCGQKHSGGTDTW